MARRRRLTRVARLTPRPDKPPSASDPEAEMKGLLVDVMEPTCTAEEEDEELDLVAMRRFVAESVGAPVSTCATLFLYGGDLLFERTAPDGLLTLGRLPTSDIVLEHSSVSRRHAELTYRDDAWFIRDLGSTSGTKVNRKPVTISTRLREGDRVKLGKVRLNVGFSLPQRYQLKNEEQLEDTGKEARDSDKPEETPVLGFEPSDESAVGVPTIHETHDYGDDESQVIGSANSGRAEAKKRSMEVQERKEVERIKTIGIVGVAILLTFAVVGIVGSVNRPPKGKPTPPKPDAAANEKPDSEAPAKKKTDSTKAEPTP